MDENGGHQHYIDSGGSAKVVSSKNKGGEREYQSKKHYPKDPVQKIH